MEVPTVSTRVSGIPELIEHNVSGLLVDEQNPSALADAIAKLLRNHELAENLAKGGRRKVIDEFNLDTTSQQLVEIFQHYLATDRTFQMRVPENITSKSLRINPQTNR